MEDKWNRIIALGNRVSLKNIKEIFSFQGDLLLQQLHRSGLLINLKSPKYSNILWQPL